MNVQADRLKQAIEILKIPSSQRAEVQISFLQQETNHIGLFKQYKEEDGNDELQRLCCMYMKYEYFGKDQTVFKIDDIGNKFYIVLSGKVGVYIRMPKHKRQEAILESGGNFNHYEEDPLQMVKELRMGDSFGELALMKNSKRLASIICREDSHFGVIDKKIFNLCLKEKEEEKLNIQMRFLANSPLFSRLPKNTIKILHMNAFYVQYQKNQSVYLEGQNSSACYVIKQGEFTQREIKESIQSDSELDSYHNQEFDLLNITFAYIFAKKAFLDLFQDQLISQLILFSIIKKIYKTIDHVLKPYEKKNQYLTGGDGQRNIDVKISVLGVGELFGEIELVQGDQRKTSAYCTSLDGGELMIINRTDLEGRVLCEEEYKQQFQKFIEMKKIQLKSRVEGITSQLSKYSNYRFMTSALKIHQVDVCEQIKNKELNYSIDVLDDIIQSQNEAVDDDAIGILSSQKTALQKQQQLILQSHKQKSKSTLVNQQIPEKETKSQNVAQTYFQASSNKQISSSHEIPEEQAQQTQQKSQNSIQMLQQQPQTHSQNLNITNNSSRHNHKQELTGEKISEVTSHITKNSKEQFMSRYFGNNDNNEQNQKQQIPKKQRVILELNSYSNLKNSIRKKTAVALSKQYRMPYEKFMYASSMYDISKSENQVLPPQQVSSAQQIPTQESNHRESKTALSTSKSRGKSLLTLNNLSTSRQMNSSSNIQNSMSNSNITTRIKSLVSIDRQLNHLNLKKSFSKCANKEDTQLNDIKESNDGEESVRDIDIAKLQQVRRVQSQVSMRSAEKQSNSNYYQMDQYQQDTQNIDLLSKLKQFKFKKFNEINSQDQINSNQNLENAQEKENENEIQQNEAAMIMQSIGQHYDNSNNEEEGKKYQQRLKNILKLDIQTDNPTVDCSPISSSQLNTPNLLQSKKMSLSSVNDVVTNSQLKSKESKNPSNSVSLKFAEILFEKNNRRTNKKQHLRLHDNKDSPSKTVYSQSNRSSFSSAAVFSAKKFMDESPLKISNTLPKNPFGSYGGQSEQNDPLSKQHLQEQHPSLANNFAFSLPMSPHNNATTSKTSRYKSQKITLSNYFRPREYKREEEGGVLDEQENKDSSLAEKFDSTFKGEFLQKSQNMQRSLVLKNNSSVQDMKKAISIKSLASVTDLNRAQSSERPFRNKFQPGIHSSQSQQQNTNVFLNTLSSSQSFSKKLPKDISPYTKKKVNRDALPIYKFQQDSPLVVKKCNSDQPQQIHLTKPMINQYFTSPKYQTNL